MLWIAAAIYAACSVIAYGLILGSEVREDRTWGVFDDSLRGDNRISALFVAMFGPMGLVFAVFNRRKGSPFLWW